MEIINDNLKVIDITILSQMEAFKLPEQLRTTGYGYWLRTSDDSQSVMEIDKYGNLKEYKLTDFHSSGIRPLVTFMNPGYIIEKGDVITNNGLIYDVIDNQAANNPVALCRSNIKDALYLDIDNDTFADMYMSYDKKSKDIYDSSEIKAYLKYVFPEEYGLSIYEDEPRYDR